MKKSIKWTYESLMNESMKYNTRGEFRKGNSKAYSSSNKHNRREEIFSHMPPIVKVMKNHWSEYDNCHAVALTCLSRMEFRKKSQVAYNSLMKMKRLDEACSHMMITGNKMQRFVYAYEFPNKHVYVGLCGNKKKREKDHKRCGTVYEYIKKTGLNPKLVYATTQPMSVQEASIMEGLVLDAYVKNGWYKLNIMPTGGIGGNVIIWTPESCSIEAKKYTSRTDFSNGSRGAYVSANKLGIMDVISIHMKPVKNKKVTTYL
jgi:predicted GIY-YIG superfamily endonuclease